LEAEDLIRIGLGEEEGGGEQSSYTPHNQEEAKGGHFRKHFKKRTGEAEDYICPVAMSGGGRESNYGKVAVRLPKKENLERGEAST